jgi:hypothetical protein
VNLSPAVAVIALAGCLSVLSGCGSAATPHLSLASDSCIPKSTGGAHGKTETRYCGPATATLLLGGKTYQFRDGRCNSDKAIGLALGVTLGTIDYGDLKTNGGHPLFQLQIDEQPIAIETVNASSGGKSLILLNTVKTNNTDSRLLSGTFQSSKGAFDTGKRFSGSWDCGGKLYAD